MARTKVFISYAHEDDSYRKQLEAHLGVLVREGLIDVCSDRRIAVGTDWRNRLHEHMLKARIAILLISSSFLTSDFIREEEVPKLFDTHEANGMRIYPLLIRACLWEEVPWLARMQIRPADAQPVSSRRGYRREQLLTDVARDIATIARAKDQRQVSSHR